MKREHFGACMVRSNDPMPCGVCDPCRFYGGTMLCHSIARSRWAGTYPTMVGAIEALDPFNDATYWPLRNVIPYLSRMGVHQ